jgi:hypothetical protein
MRGNNDLRVLRERTVALEDALDAAAQDANPFASPALVGITTVVSSYPTSPNVYFAVNPGTCTSTEMEGASGTVNADASTVVYALNLGTQVPAQGATICVHALGGRWVFRYDG